MPKWVVGLKGVHRGRIGIFAGAYEETISKPRVKWASGQHDDLKRTSSRVGADRIRIATPDEIQAHFHRYPDDEWQMIDAEERRELPCGKNVVNWELEDGRVETWTIEASLRSRGKIEVRSPSGQVVELVDDVMEGHRLVRRHYDGGPT